METIKIKFKRYLYPYQKDQIVDYPKNRMNSFLEQHVEFLDDDYKEEPQEEPQEEEKKEVKQMNKKNKAILKNDHVK